MEKISVRADFFCGKGIVPLLYHQKGKTIRVDRVLCCKKEQYRIIFLCRCGCETKVLCLYNNEWYVCQD